jgi:hypothetical protein
LCLYLSYKRARASIALVVVTDVLVSDVSFELTSVVDVVSDASAVDDAFGDCDVDDVAAVERLDECDSTVFVSR